MFSFESKEATQHWSFCVGNNFVPNKVCVSRERVYANNVLISFRFVRYFSSQQNSKVIPNNSFENAT